MVNWTNVEELGNIKKYTWTLNRNNLKRKEEKKKLTLVRIFTKKLTTREDIEMPEEIRLDIIDNNENGEDAQSLITKTADFLVNFKFFFLRIPLKVFISRSIRVTTNN